MNPQGKIANNFFAGRSFQMIDTLPNQDLTQQMLVDGIRLGRANNGFMLRGFPNNGQTDNFRITKRLRDAVSLVWCEDVDLRVTDDLLGSDQRSIAKDIYSMNGISPNIGCVILWSSSRFVKGIEKIGAHLYFILTRPYTGEEIAEATKNFVGDPHMSEPSRIHCLLPPTFESDDLIDTNGSSIADIWDQYSEITIIEGEPLDLTKVTSTPKTKSAHTAPREDYAQEIDRLNRRNIRQELKNFFRQVKNVNVDWKNINALCEAADELLKEDKIRHRHFIHYWLMEHSQQRIGDLNIAKDKILQMPNLLGKHKESDLDRQAKKIKADWIDHSTGGDIRSIFSTKEMIEVNYESFSQLTESEFDRLNMENGLFVTDAACGLGKTYFVIRPAIEKYDSETNISIAARHSVLQSQAKMFDLEYMNDIGKDDPIFSNLNQQQRKQQFFPEAKNPAITIQSLQYILKDGTVIERKIAILEEFEKTLRELVIEPELKGNTDKYDRCGDQFYALCRVLEKCSGIWITDNNLSRDFTGWFIQKIQEFTGMEKRLLKNHFDFVSRMNFFKVPTESEAILTAARQIEEGKTIAIVTDYADNPLKGTINRIANPIKELTGLKDNEIFAMTAERKTHSLGKKLTRDLNTGLSNWIDDGGRCFLTSPVFQDGIDYSMDGKHKFDAVIVIIGHGLTHPKDIKQMLRRFRLTTDVYFYIKERYRRAA